MYISRVFCEQTEKKISKKTVTRRLDKEKLVARIPWSKLLISTKNQKVRLDFSTEHIPWTEEQSNMIHFCDKSTFMFFASDYQTFVRRKNRKRSSPQCVKKTVKLGGPA